MAISAARAKYLEESNVRQHGEKIRNLKAVHQKEYRAQVKKNKMQIEEIRDRYEGQINSLEAELEGKLVQMRSQHRKKLEREKMRLDNELEMLRSSYGTKREELELGRLEEFEMLVQRYRQIIKNAEMKADQEKRRAEMG